MKVEEDSWGWGFTVSWHRVLTRREPPPPMQMGLAGAGFDWERPVLLSASAGCGRGSSGHRRNVSATQEPLPRPPFTPMLPTHHHPNLVVKASRSAQLLRLKPFTWGQGKAQSEAPWDALHLVWSGVWEVCFFFGEKCWKNVYPNKCTSFRAVLPQTTTTCTQSWGNKTIYM